MNTAKIELTANQILLLLRILSQYQLASGWGPEQLIALRIEELLANALAEAKKTS